MKQKTYGVRGLMEWNAVLRVGRAVIEIPFSGGALTAFGNTPAMYTTRDKFFQSIIEGSEAYKRGKIELLKSVEDGEEEIKREEIKREEKTVESEEDRSVREIEVADKSEAIEYLKENFDNGYSATKLRSNAAFESACVECGVRFVFTT